MRRQRDQPVVGRVALIETPQEPIPFDKLVLSLSNVRKTKSGVSIEELVEDIARRGLLQGHSVRAVVDADGKEHV